MSIDLMTRVTDGDIKDETLIEVLASFPYANYPKLTPEQICIAANGKPGFTDFSPLGQQKALEYCHYWLSANWGNQPGFPGAPVVVRTQIELDAIQPDGEIHATAFTLTCQSFNGSFESGDVIYFNAVAQETTFVDPQTLTCAIAATQIEIVGAVPVQVQSADAKLQSATISFSIL